MAPSYVVLLQSTLSSSHDAALARYMLGFSWPPEHDLFDLNVFLRAPVFESLQANLVFLHQAFYKRTPCNRLGVLFQDGLDHQALEFLQHRAQEYAGRHQGLVKDLFQRPWREAFEACA